MWRTNSIQLVWFFDQNLAIPASVIYERLIGRRPKSTQTEFIQTPADVEVSSAVGDSVACNYNVQVQPARVDLFINPVAKPFPTTSGPPSFMDPRGAVGAIAQRVLSAAELWQDPNRLACVITSSFETPTAIDAVFKCRDLLDMKVAPDTALDLNFTLNLRHTTDRAPIIELNRVIRWATATFQQFNMPAHFTAAQSGGTIMLPPNAVTTLHAVTLEVDVNTTSASKNFSKERQQSVISTLVDQALTLTEKASLEEMARS